MAIKGNVDLTKAHDILTKRYDMGAPNDLGDTVIINPDEEPLIQMILSRHAMNVRINEKIEKGQMFMQVVPAWLVDAVIKWE